ncbi:hypothetical protein KCU98_g7650, partial [Aureobasidium melanogenum]
MSPIESASPKPFLIAPLTYPSLKFTDIKTWSQDLSRSDFAQLLHCSDSLWSERSRPVSSQGERLNDGLISRIRNLDLVEDTGDSVETSIEQQLNDATNAPDEEECPTGHDTLDCEDCGGPEQTWETSHNDYHCKGIEAERYRWKDCYCINWENDRGPCRLGHDWDDNYFPFKNLPDLPSPSGNSSDHEDPADDPSDPKNEPTNGQDALESGLENSATATEEEEQRTEQD